MNAYYHSLIEEIKKEIDEKSYAQAYELICQELNMPYVPEDALELLEYYKSECKPYLEQKSKSMDFSKVTGLCSWYSRTKNLCDFYFRKHEFKNVS